jgi:signal transduction histidine kinase
MIIFLQVRRRLYLRVITHRLHSLSLRLEVAREEERARVARELHDELGQVLTSLKLEFMWLVDQLRKTDPRPGVQLVNKLQSLIGLIEISIQSVRQISSDLRPAVLDHLGLREAVEWEALKFESRTGIRCRVTWKVKTELRDRSRELALYRILQEALTNVARHAHAGAVRIGMQKRGRSLLLTIRDNGRGITRHELSSEKSIGLLGMTERARFLGGRIAISGKTGRGTTVTVSMPVERGPVRRKEPRPPLKARSASPSAVRESQGRSEPGRKAGGIESRGAASRPAGRGARIKHD